MKRINVLISCLITLLVLASLIVIPRPALAQEQLPDLTVLDAWQTGNQIQYRIQNNGPGNISGVIALVSFYNALFVDDILVAQDHVTVPLAVGQQLERTFEYHYQATPPSNTIRIIADYQQDITEGNEQNNIWEAVWQVTENLPDLVVEKIECGEGNKLMVTIKNIGEGLLPSGWSALGQIWISNQDKGNFSLQNPTFNTNGGIATSGGSSSYLLLWDIVEPTVVACIVDITNSIGEADEQNNYREETVVPLIVKLPDLVIAEIEYDQKASNISYMVKNIGAGDASTSFTCRLSLSDPFVYEDSEAQATLKSGETYTLYFNLSALSLGSEVTVKVCADTYDQVKESNEQNNCLERTFQIKIEVLPLRIVSGPSVMQVTQNSAQISWTTNLPSDSTVRYDSRAGGYGSTADSPSLVTEHRIQLENLKPATTYHLVVNSIDESGSSVTSRDLNFETPSSPDDEKPSLSLLIPDTLSGRVPISVNTQDNIGVDRVVFFIDGKPVHTDYSYPFEWECTTGVLDDGSHDFGTQSLDSAGNMAEEVRDSDVQNLFAADLSPVHVRITTPEVTSPGSRAEVYGEVPIGVEVTSDLESGIKNIRVEVDGEVICERVYTKGYYIDHTWVLTGYPQPPVYETFVWAAGVEWDSTNVIEVSAQDQHGNWGHAGISAIITRPSRPAIPIPSVQITRNVERVLNHFVVELEVHNEDGSNIRNLRITEIDQERCLFAGGETTYNRNYTGEYDTAAHTTDIVMSKPGELGPGSSWTFCYYLIPLVTVLPTTPCTLASGGVRLEFEFQHEGDWRSHELILRPMDVLEDKIISAGMIMEALRSANYLIITNPSKLFEHYPRGDVDDLLTAIGRLAKLRGSIVAPIGGDWSAGTIRNVIRENWGPKLADGWLSSGYLLLVGETEIVPSWSIPCPGFFTDKTGGIIEISDYLYADISGDDQPELKVGRIIGSNAEELLMPIQASIDVCEGSRDYDGSDVLLITGYEDTWEAAIKNAEGGRVTVAGKGVTAPVPVVHTEFYTTEHTMLAEALRIKGSDDGGAAFDPDPPMSSYTVEQLAVWLLDSEEIYWDIWPLEEYPELYTEFTDSEGRQHRWPPAYFGDDEVQQALRIAGRIQADRGGRGGDYGWTYTYCRTGEEVLRSRAQEVKAQTPDKDVIIFLGHGGAGSWACVLDDWTTSECPIEPIDFGRSCPVVIAFSCLTGNYEDEPGRSIAKAFLRNGAAVYIGSTEVSSTGHNEEVTREGFWRSWTRSSRIGDAFFDMQRRKIREGGNWRYFVYEYNLYGDPKFGE